MTLSIRPVRLNKSIYLRVPNDIADLIEIDHQAGVTLGFEEQGDRFLLVYAVQKLVAGSLVSSQPSDAKPIASRPRHGKVDM